MHAAPSRRRVAHGHAPGVDDAEREALLAATAQLGREDLDLEAGVVRDGEAVDLGRALVAAVLGVAGRLGAAGVAGGVLAFLAPRVGVERAAGGSGHGEEHGEDGAEAHEAGGGADPTTS